MSSMFSSALSLVPEKRSLKTGDWEDRRPLYMQNPTFSATRTMFPSSNQKSGSFFLSVPSDAEIVELDVKSCFLFFVGGPVLDTTSASELI